MGKSWLCCQEMISWWGYAVCLLQVSLVCPDYVGQTVSGEVWQGNYTYYTLKQGGVVRLVLTSVEGDADLYVSGEEVSQPTFLLEDHSLSSASCGDDTVYISEHFVRPIHIGRAVGAWD